MKTNVATDPARGPDRTLSIAPMMECTDRHYRRLMRCITRHTLLYTEMIPTDAALHGDRDRFLGFSPEEHPIALQVGGSGPRDMAECARLAERRGFDEININVGCPSDRVQSGRFGACLMAEPEVVARCVLAMREAAALPVTVKTRIGIDHRDSYAVLEAFVSTVAQAGCQTFIVHARKAWLSGLSPKQNREIPPLRYDIVYRLKREFPALEIIVNGGVRTLADAEIHLAGVDGVMIGREAYRNPYAMAGVDRKFFGDPHPVPTRHQIVEGYLPYIEGCVRQGVPLHRITRHMPGLFQGRRGARHWRRCLGARPAHSRGCDTIRETLAMIETHHDL